VTGPRFWIVVGGATIASAVLFTLWPGLDLAIAGWMYGSDQAFASSETGLWGFIHNSGPRAALTLLGAAILLGAASRWLPLPVTPSRRDSAYLTLALLIGPGLIVNAGLKSYWGRARPSQVAEFGGDAMFTPALVMAEQCASNCSFVSGDAAVGFCLTAFAFIVPAPFRWPVFTAGVAAGCALGAARIAQGAHFPSDILFAGLIVIAVNAALAHWMLGHRSSPARAGAPGAS